MKNDNALEYFKTIGNIHRLLHRQMASVMPEMLNPLQVVIAHYLKEHSGCKTTDLAEHLGLAASTLTGILDRMEEQNLIKRERSTSDRRVVTVSPGSAFDNMKEKMQASLDEFLKIYGEDLDEQWWENMLLQTKRLEELMRKGGCGCGSKGDNCGR